MKEDGAPADVPPDDDEVRQLTERVAALKRHHDCAALALRNVMRIPRREFRIREDLTPISCVEAVDIPFAGWIGPEYDGVVVVGKNPGGGGDTQITKPADASVQRCVRTLIEAEDDDVPKAQAALSDQQRHQLKSIGMGKLLNNVLSALDVSLEQIAFLNLCPFRTRNDKTPHKATHTFCVERVLKPMLAALDPHTVVLLGGFASHAEGSLSAQRIYKLKRAINDNQLHRDAILVLEKMRVESLGL
jgi:uracil-DNA glycosylase